MKKMQKPKATFENKSIFLMRSGPTTRVSMSYEGRTEP